MIKAPELLRHPKYLLRWRLLHTLLQGLHGVAVLVVGKPNLPAAKVTSDLALEEV